LYLGHVVWSKTIFKHVPPSISSCWFFSPTPPIHFCILKHIPCSLSALLYSTLQQCCWRGTSPLRDPWNYLVNYQRFCLFLPIRWMMPTSGIVPIPCADAAEGMVQLPANSKCPSKLLGALACRAARRKVLEHVALGHGSRVVQRKSLPLVGFTSLPVASLLSTATTATSSPMSKEEVTSPSPPFGKSTPPARRLPRVEVQVVPVIKDRSWQCHLCTYEQELVPGSRTCITCHSTRRWLHRAPWCVVKSKLVDRMKGSGKSGFPNCRLGNRCRACLLARREKCINDLWIDAKGSLK
jgi:hypothetical protein